jgi:hypothetical protein
MDWSVQLLITGAAIAIISSLATIVVQHMLALRVDNILRERTRQSRQGQPDWDSRAGNIGKRQKCELLTN